MYSYIYTVYILKKTAILGRFNTFRYFDRLQIKMRPNDRATFLPRVNYDPNRIGTIGSQDKQNKYATQKPGRPTIYKTGL